MPRAVGGVFAAARKIDPATASAVLATIAAMVLARVYPPPQGLPHALPLGAIVVVTLGLLGVAATVLTARPKFAFIRRQWLVIVIGGVAVAAAAALAYSMKLNRDSVYFAADGHRFALGTLRDDESAAAEREACVAAPAPGVVESEPEQLIDCAQGDASRFWTADSVVTSWVIFNLLHLTWIGSLLTSAIVGASRATARIAQTAPAIIHNRDPGPASEDGASSVDLDTHVFDAALSYAGEDGEYVAEVAAELCRRLGPHRVFYDRQYAGQTARPSLDLLLEGLYRQRARLIVLFIGEHYQRKNWTSLELRSVRDRLLRREFEKVMLIRMDDGIVDGILESDGYIDARQNAPERIARFIVERVHLISSREAESVSPR
jgi:hypothetical protein